MGAMNDSSKALVSVVSPVYGAEKIVEELVRRLVEVLESLSLDYEIVLVEDGSPDNSWVEVVKACQDNDRVKGVKLSRNFGQHYAISCGLKMARGDYVIVMDCDLQDDPKYIPELIDKAEHGAEIVYTTKIKRRHSFFKNITAKMYTRVFNFLSDSNESREDVGSYSLLTRKVVEAFNQIADQRRHYLLIVRLLGFKTAYLQIEHQPRFQGRSSYNFFKLMSHAIDGITSQSDKLLRLSIYIGIFFSLIAFVGAFWTVYMALFNELNPGWPSLFVMSLFSLGVVEISIGVLGLYVSRIYEQTKNRPLYFVDRTLNFRCVNRGLVAGSRELDE